MADPTQIKVSSATVGTTNETVSPTPLRCLLGAAVSAALTFAMCSLTQAVASTFARTPIQTDNFTVYRISTAVRTLVIGMTTLGVWVFGIACLGLLGLMLQLLIRSLTKQTKKPETNQ